jgi:tRNA 2-thiouridine synthesizing protein A
MQKENNLLDVRKLLCPLPIVKTQKKIESLTRNEVLQIVLSGEKSLADLSSWAKISGHKIIKKTQKDNDFFLKIKITR